MSELEYPVYENSELTTRELLAILRRRRWTLVGTFALFVAIAAVLTSRATPIYQAHATMVIEQAPLRLQKIEDGPLEKLMQPAQPHTIATQIQMLKSGPLQARVMKRLGPLPDEAYPDLGVGQVGETEILQVMAESSDPRVARDAANGLVAEYIQQNEVNSLAHIRRARQFTQRRLAEAEGRLERADAELRDFKERHRLPDLLRNRDSAIAQVDRVREELRQSDNQLTSLRSQMQQVSSQLARKPLLVQGGFSRGTNPAIASIEADIQRFEQQRISLLRTLKPGEPEVREVDDQIRRLKDRLAKQPATVVGAVAWQPSAARSALQSQLEGLQTQVRGLEPQVALLRRQHRNAQERLSAFPAQETTLVKLERRRDELQEAQKTLSGQLRDLVLSEQAQTVGARPLALATLPGAPVRPRTVMNMLVASMLGLVFGIGAACLREMTDGRVQTADEAERLLGLPILGRVPIFAPGTPRLISPQGESPAKESYRRLRAGIAFASQSESVRSLLVTSATAGEGKSTTAANLAMAAALQGRRVILVDADLRDPSLDPLFGVSHQPGLSEVLCGSISTSEALQPTGVPELMLLPAGSPVSNVAELLAGPRMTELIQELSAQADLVILDTPPCLPVADAEVLGNQVDATVLVVGLGRTDKQAVRMARELLDQAHVRLVGAVLNRMKPGDHGYYYRYRSPAVPSAVSPGAATPVLPGTIGTVASEYATAEEKEA
jgi:succinoglycan biosynthesis transport protein ExoP